MNKAGEILARIEEYVLFFVIGIFGIFVFSGLGLTYVIPKEIFLIVGASLILLIWVTRSIIKGSISFAVGKFDLGVILFTLAYLISVLVKTPNKAEAFLYPGVATFTFAAIVFYFLVNQFAGKVKEGAYIALFASGILLSLSMLATQFGLFALIPQLPAFLKASDFNPLGGLLPSAIYLITILPIGILMVLKNKDVAKKMFFGVASAVIVLGFALSIAGLLPGKPQSPTFPSMDTSWQVAVETIKVSPFLGAGPGNYLTSFNLYRPLSYNQTALWQARFTTAGDFYFTFLTELGFVGLAALVILLLSVYNESVSDIKHKSFEIIPVILLLVIFLILPSVPSLMFLLFVLLAINSKSENKIVAVSFGKVPSLVTTLPVLAGIIAVIFFGTREVMAESTYNKALNALASNNAQTTYNSIVQAVNENPAVDRYHSALAQVDMAIANSLASKGSNLTDTDRTTITQLIQSAISEGKATVTLNPTRSGNWQILASIYNSIIPLAQGADQFAIQTYTQAVALDPIDPNVRISLGGVYYALGDYADAISTFKLATLAKPDLANAHYNLAIAYRDSKDYTDAVTEMNSVLSLVKTGTPDYTLAQSTLADIQKNIPAPKTTTTGQTLTTPSKTTPVIKPPLTLPQEATPPASQ
jgi:tetratricopeptide (TPR) repeat protein